MILYIFNFRMNNFLKNIAILFTIIVVSSIILDKIYTYIHYNGTPRNIPDYIMSLKEKDSLDYAIFGSSRALHNIDINLIEQETTKKGFNFGIRGSSVFEIKLSIQQIIKRKITKNIYIQIDYIWNEFNSGGECTVDWLTYINENDIWNEFQKIDTKNDKYYLYKKIPFFRYCEYGSKLGFRELIMSLSNRKMKVINNKGFVPLFGKLKNDDKPMTYQLKKEFNPHLQDIIELCKKENVNLFFFTSPIYNFKGNNKVLKESLPNYIDFSNAIHDAKYYQDNTHLNNKGSFNFTKLFIKEYINTRTHNNIYKK